MRQKLFSAFFLFVWGGFFLTMGIIEARSGRSTSGHWGIPDGPDVTPETNPSGFLTGIIICFVFAVLGFLLGVRDLFAYLRCRKTRR